jgi:hypothetical protein
MANFMPMSRDFMLHNENFAELMSNVEIAARKQIFLRETKLGCLHPTYQTETSTPAQADAD